MATQDERECVECGHEHTSANLGHICIGCPCPVGQPPAEEYPDVSGGGVPYPPVSAPSTPSEQDEVA